ncbi:MAG: biotin/lipoyl-binding protein [Clostridia bacterium]|nr:biotin/lipoyl-binding protein [Clostridia bacterium]
MRRRCRAAVVVALTVLAVAGMAWLRQERPRAAQIVRVSAGEVHCVAALAGRVGYTGGHGAFAPWPGQVAEVYVQPGQRVAAGQALVRLEAAAVEQAVAAWAATESDEGGQALQQMLESTIIRAPENATVRQVLTQAHAPVQAGDALVTLSDAQQVILCMAVERDARDLRVGMDAVLRVDGEVVGEAEVTRVGAVEAEAETGRMVCPIELTPRQRLALPEGAAVEAEVTLLRRGGVPVLPLQAVTERGTLWWVHDGICTEIPAGIVLSDEMRAWVDLPEGIAVAVGEFREGQRVQEASP